MNSGRGKKKATRTAEEDMESARVSVKSIEAFVPWRVETSCEGRRPSAVPAAHMAAGKGTKKVAKKSPNSVVLPHSPKSRRLQNPETERTANAPGGSPAIPPQQSGMGASEGRNDISVSGRREEGSKGKVNSCQEKPAGRSPSNLQARPTVSLGRRCHVPTIAGNALKTVEKENYLPDVNLRTSSYMRFHKAVDADSAGEYPALRQKGRDALRNPSTSAGVEPDVVQVRRRFRSLVRQETESHESEHEDVDLLLHRAKSINKPKEPQNEVVVYDSDRIVDNVTDDSEEERESADEVEHEGIQDANDKKDKHLMAVADESKRRRGRRQEMSMREREADRRMKEGQPRNFLLVDEYTRKPYGPGVGAWRKELMLLSRSLDPAVGNINRHPEGAVQEIADWIKHTWEYEKPVHYEVVKEVIARGVTLRRADLWKKIRNKEGRPDGVSDRSWRTLRKQLQSPATIQKSESCRRANASRINFGRTGPSGEVGVRQRLRRALRRSPNPEEIQKEMLRDKGYGGYSKSQRKSTDVMHGSEAVVEVFVEGERLIATSAGSTENADADPEDSGHVHGGSEALSMPMRFAKNNGDEVVREHVLAMSADEIAQHPVVMKMMQRLAALEGRESILAVDEDDASMHERSSAQEIGDDDYAGRNIESHEVEEGGHCLHTSGGETASTSRQKRKRAKHI